MLGQHPAVGGSGVIGRSDPERGQVPVAFVTVKPGTDVAADDVRAWLAERLASFKVPEVRVLDALPMTATGKVKKGELAAFLD